MLVSKLEMGWPLSGAIEVAIPEMPERAVRLVAAGEHLGQACNRRLRRLMSEQRPSCAARALAPSLHVFLSAGAGDDDLLDSHVCNSRAFFPC